MKKIRLLLVAAVAVLMMTACGPSPEELVRQGKEHCDNDNYTEAMACFQKAAEKGNAEAEFNIGMLYDCGDGVDEDSEIAADWYKKSAEKGYSEAQDILSLMYYLGTGVEQNYEKAAAYAKKALAQDEYYKSYLVLGSLYARGEALPRDHKKAVENLQKAADINFAGKLMANDYLLYLYLEGDGTQDDEKAIETKAFKSDPDDAERAQAMFNIGKMYEEGEELDYDAEKAFKWYNKAANAGHPEAQLALGYYYYFGEGVTESLQDAKYWWQKAADQGNEEAEGNLEYIRELERKAEAAEKAKQAAQENARRLSNSKNVFSISPNMKVKFAFGNLQYQASTKTWRFAEHQWDVIGNANKNISPNYSGWIDLFGWGTGKNPTNKSQDNSDYKYDLDIFFVDIDWGYKNNISNGGKKTWFSLSKDNWEYVLDKRSTISGIRYAKAVVNGVSGVILLPDKWNTSNYSLNDANKADVSFSSNIISQSDWTNKLEANGAIFLPAAGYRIGTSVYSVGYDGYYWSSKYYEEHGAHTVWFDRNRVGANYWNSRRVGSCVRLACLAGN